MILALAIPAAPAVTFVADTVADSATGNWLNGVKVAYSATCTTETDANGLFSIIIPGTAFIFSAPKNAAKIFYDPAKNYFYAGEEKVSVAIFNGKGDLMIGDKLSPGNYFAVCRFGSFRFLNLAGQKQLVVFGGGTGSGTTNGLEKSLASNATLTFSKSGYYSKSLTLNFSPATNPRVKLSAIAPAGSNANLNIGIAPLDTLKGVATIP